MVRTVRVRLELDRDSFKQGLRDSAASMRTFDGDVKTLGKDAERTGVELKQTGTQVGKLGDDVKRSSREVTNLGRELDTARGKLRDLGDEYKRSGNVELQHYKSLTGEVRKLERAKRDLDKLGGDGQGKGGGILGAISGSGMGSTFGLSPSVATALVAAATVAAPAMGAAISAGVLLGLGGGTLAGGIILAAKDPAVKGAFTSLGTEVAGDLSKASQVFVQPLVGSADIFRAAWADVGPQIARDFDAVAPAVTHLSAGVAGFARNVMPGLNDSVRASASLLNQVGDDTLPRTGAAVGQMLSLIAQGSGGAKDFLKDLTTGADLSVKQLGAVTLALSKLYELERSGGQGGNIFEKMSSSALSATLGGTFNAWTTGLEKLDGGAKKADDSVKRLKDSTAASADAMGRIGFQAGFTGDELSKMSSKISGAALSTDALAAAMTDKLLGATLGLDQATLGFAQRQTGLGDVLKSNHSLQDISTTKGQQLREAVLGVVQANIAEYDAMVAAKGSTEEAAAAYDVNTAALDKQLSKAGLTRGEIDKLIGKYREVPDNVNTDVQTKGLTEAIASLDDAIRLANHLDGRVSVITIEERHRITYSADTPPSQFFRGLARGGVVAYAKGGVEDYKKPLTDYTARGGLLKPSNPGTILAGEPSTGGEVFGPRLGVSHERGLQLAGVLAGWHGGQVVRAGPMGGAGGQVTVVLKSDPIPLTLDGRKIGELLISDADHGGTAMNAYIRRVANR